MKTLKCKNCGRKIGIKGAKARCAEGDFFHTIDYPSCRQNIEYSHKDFPQYIVDEPVVNDAEDEINKPKHYHKGGIDVIGYAEKKFSAEERKGFYRISALKYITRYEDKGQPIKDLNKAKFFINKLIELEEGRE